MEDLIKDIQDRTGLPADKVLEVVTMVTDYLKRALPPDLVDQVTSYLGVAAESATTAAGTARAAASTGASTAAGAISSASGIAQSAFSAARDAVSERVSPSES